MEDLHKKGWALAVMRYLLEKGMLHVKCMTVTGQAIT
ncbi:MAG: hypothetical protein EOM62_01205 [Bacteroidia bacterium]|nr:hypothetical protein [Bacteroidia bacterium]